VLPTGGGGAARLHRTKPGLEGYSVHLFANKTSSAGRKKKKERQLCFRTPLCRKIRHRDRDWNFAVETEAYPTKKKKKKKETKKKKKKEKYRRHVNWRHVTHHSLKKKKFTVKGGMARRNA